MSEVHQPPRRPTGPTEPLGGGELAFMQRKLEKLYERTYLRLSGRREEVHITQEILVWKRPVMAALLYLGIHWTFFYLATTQENPLSQFFSLLFWLLVGDAVWRAATKDGRSDDTHTSGAGSARGSGRGSGRWVSGRWVSGRRRESRPSGVVSFERALLMAAEEQRSHQLLPFEVVCLSIARWWMWLDNLWLALCHWSVHDRLMFTLALTVPGLVLVVVGSYVPTLVLLYIAVMGAIVWPYISYHNLIERVSNFFVTHFPMVLERGKAAWQFMKTIFSRDEREISELSLSRGTNDHEVQEILNTEFRRATSRPGKKVEGEGEREAKTEREEERGREEREEQKGKEDGGEEKGREKRRGDGGGGRGGLIFAARRDPGMSILQDSVFGLTADAFHNVEDSMAVYAPISGEFPSISTLDQSLNLPQFPPEHSVSPAAPALTAIDESQEAEIEDDQLDPFTDSIDLEFGINIPDGYAALKHRSKSTAPSKQPNPHPLAQYSVSAPSREPGPAQDANIARKTPPPSYEAVVEEDEYWTPVTNGATHFYPELIVEPPYEQTAPRSSSTPFVDEQL